MPAVQDAQNLWFITTLCRACIIERFFGQFSQVEQRIIFFLLAHMNDSMVPLTSRSIFGTDPVDEFANKIADWIWEHSQGQEGLEIEAKIGVLIDKRTNARIQLPIYTEAIVNMREINARFESNMSMKQHRIYNKLLNELVAYSAQNLPQHEHMAYQHRKETDSFYDEVSETTGQKEHIRVTRDNVTQEIVPNGVIKKTRIADLNVFCPAQPYDYRISINTETPISPPQNMSQPTFSREKDRLSYTQQNFSVDLTQVIMANRIGEPLHELEIEIRDVNYLMHLANEAQHMKDGSERVWTKFEDHILVLLNNIRLLIRNHDFESRGD